MPFCWKIFTQKAKNLSSFRSESTIERKKILWTCKCHSSVLYFSTLDKKTFFRKKFILESNRENSRHVLNGYWIALKKCINWQNMASYCKSILFYLKLSFLRKVRALFWKLWNNSFLYQKKLKIIIDTWQ